MLLRELYNQSLDEKQVWARSGKKVVRKYRCAGGRRNGRVVANAAQCFAAPDVKASMRLKRTKARMGKRMAKKAQKTKRVNPASRRVQSMNKSSKRKR